jgi:hypothetical protein
MRAGSRRRPGSISHSSRVLERYCTVGRRQGAVGAICRLVARRLLCMWREGLTTCRAGQVNGAWEEKETAVYMEGFDLIGGLQQLFSGLFDFLATVLGWLFGGLGL